MDVSKVLVRSCLLYDFKVGLSAAESSRRICQAFGDNAVNERTARQWFQKFRSGDMSLNDAPRSGRPQALDDETLRAAIESDSSQTCSELASHFQVTDETIRLHLHRIGKVYKLSKWVPHSLSDANKQQRVAACLSLLTRHRNASIFDRILTSDEKWVQYDTPKRFKHWLSPRDPVPHAARPSLHPRKIMLCIWWTSRQVVHYELLSVGQTITAGLYSQQLERVHQALMHKEPALVNRKGVLLLHDNARPHVAREARDTIQRLGWETLPHPPYSPDLAPTDYHLFHSLDNHLRGKSFNNQPDLEKALTDFFASKTPEFYRDGIAQLASRWQKALDADGDYFEN